VALAAVADDGHFLALDEIDVGITIIIDAHTLCSCFAYSPFLTLRLTPRTDHGHEDAAYLFQCLVWHSTGTGATVDALRPIDRAHLVDQDGTSDL
jgi:hypothetical protein